MRVEAVEATNLAGDDAPALGGVGIGIGQGHKIRWKCGVTIHSYAVLRVRSARMRAKRERQCSNADPAFQE
ncbi:hypothetical protein GCM10011363_13770 [Marivita lacus]|uniref:Uncharacterized protein n=1 Tax=Marivita lacus TaxID=1323742 RepID=A0ABQ1KGB4_9RHOB|nr:hypothetical protein GCM10011363_13770 [Marivita lacus]